MAGFRFIRKYPGLSTLLSLEVTAFLLVSYQIQVDGRVSLLEKLGLLVIGPVQHVSHRVLGSWSQYSDDRHDLNSLRDENRILRRSLIDMENLKIQLEDLRRQNARFKALLELPERDGWNFLGAEVIGRTIRRNDYLLVINRGTRHGIRRDLGVFCPNGVVGVIWEATPYYAKVMTVNNPGSVVAALVERSRYMESFISGAGGAFGRLENFPKYEQVRPGDLILTSGLDQVFPKGYQVGKVVKTQPAADTFQEVEVKFTADFSRLEEVVVLLPVPAEAANELE